MEWWVILAWTSVCSTFLIYYLVHHHHQKTSLPPGPPSLPLIGSITWLSKSFADLEPILRRLHSLHGPLVILHIGHRPAVFVADRSLARHALVHHGALFASRPPRPPTGDLVSGTVISSSPYGPTWRALRRNLISEMLHPSRTAAFSGSRRWVLGLLLDRLGREPSPVRVVDHLRFAMFCLLALMCFGDKLDEATILDIERVQRRLLLGFSRFNILNLFPSLTKILMRSRWRELLQIFLDQNALFIPLIKHRMAKSNPTPDDIRCYVDTLLDLHLPVDDDNEDTTRKLEPEEMARLCSEFLNGGTDTTSTTLQWIMANLVMHPHIQDRLYDEIREVSGKDQTDVISEEDTVKMRYLKAVVLEGLRRHPPAHFLLPHAVSQDNVQLGGYHIPKKGTINFMVAQIGWDPATWDDPMAFNPDRFLAGDIGIDTVHNNKSGGEIKMMPFGAGRRICPATDLALLHLQFFVANLVWKFRWSPDPEHPVDLAEKQEFTIVMKHPLHACLSPRH